MPAPRPFMIRLPEELRTELQDEAERSHRSLSSQIVFALEEWMKAHAREAVTA